MALGRIVRRYLPRPLVSIYWYYRSRCLVSPRAEVEIHSNLSIGRGTVIGSFTKIKGSDGPMRIGSRVEIATSCFLSSHVAGVEIGDDTLIGPGVCVVGNNYRYERTDMTFREQGKTSKGITIGNNVWIGAGSAVLDGARIADGVIVTANSVVSSEVPENAIVRGSPAEILYTRS